MIAVPCWDNATGLFLCVYLGTRVAVSLFVSPPLCQSRLHTKYGMAGVWKKQHIPTLPLCESTHVNHPSTDPIPFEKGTDALR
jgi:hypothetical protein